MTYKKKDLKFGILGAVAALSGCGLAILTIPENYSQAGALISSAGIMTAALATVPLIRLKAAYRIVFRAEHVMLLGLVYWILLDMLQGAYDLPVTRDAVVAEFYAIGLAAVGIWLGTNVGRWPVPRFLLREATTTWSANAIFFALFLAFILGAWDFIYRSGFDLGVLIQSLGQSRFDAPWQRGQLGDWSAFSYHLQYFGYIVPALVVMLALKRGWVNGRAILGVIFSLAILLFHFQGGGRRIVGGIILIALLCWLLAQSQVDVRRNLLPTMVLLTSLLTIMQFMLLIRGAGFTYGAAEPSYEYLHVDNNFLSLAQTLELVPNVVPFVDLQFILYVLARPIPRALWPGKPEGGGFDLAELEGVADTSFAITMIGEWYVSWGFPMVFIGAWIYGRLGSIVNQFLEDPQLLRNPIIAAIGLTLLFIGMRSTIEIILMSYPLIAWLLISIILRLRKRGYSTQATALQ